jgi:hypothetical protein
VANGHLKSHREGRDIKVDWDDRKAEPGGGHRLRAVKRLLPEQPEIKHLVATYGDRLVYAHYRLNLETGQQLTTVEWDSETHPPKPSTNIRPEHLAGLTVHAPETEVRAS